MTTKMIVVTGFLVAFAAGLMVGARERIEPQSKPANQTLMISTTGPANQPRGRGLRGPSSSMIVRELNLTAQQAQQMNDIFKKTAEVGHELDERRRTAQQTRDDGIIALAKAEQNDKYEQILKNYSTEREKINDQWRNTYASGVEQAKQILSEEQRKRYEEILTRNRWDGRGPDGGPWGPDGGRRGGPGMGRTGFGGPQGQENRLGGQPRNIHTQTDNNGPTTGRAGNQSATTQPAPLG